jgi:nucleoside-diphosphate-sugar epimerase
VPLIEQRGWEVCGLDVRHHVRENLLTAGVLEEAVRDVDGIVHLAAVSRVVAAERDPELCQGTNVGVLKRMIALMAARSAKPWLIFASSREVYGEAATMPVHEGAPLQPVNTYARSKVEGERLVEEAVGAGMTASTCRFSSVYGDVNDYPDRVAMAFAGAAARGGVMRVEGEAHTFDFTHVDDAAAGLFRLVEVTSADGSQPAIHFASGVGTTLLDLARMASEYALQPVSIEEAAPRSFDVSRFIGDPSRAEQLLGWRATMELRSGMRTLIQDLARARPA